VTVQRNHGTVANAAARHQSLLTHLGLALLAYVPFLLSAPGKVSADTKQYLYLNPGRLLSRAAYLWDPNMGSGTVTHQNIGYLFPMGPYYWLAEHLGVSDWIAQRIWLGSITFAAGAGVLFLLRELDWPGAGATVAALAYMLTPYPLAYTARISVILLPWGALGWMVGLAIRSVRRRDWRSPALFALVTVTVGGTNATSLLFAGVAPGLWIVFAVVVEREATVRQALGAAMRVLVLVLVTAFWWIAGLSLQGAYGLPVLNFTETVKTVATASSPPEVLRGLGNWFFYGRDGVGPWIEQSLGYTQQLWLILVSFAIPILVFIAASVTRWRHRAYFVALVLVGMMIAVGPFPYGDPSLLGRLFKAFASGSSAGLALRSTPRAVPLIALGSAVLLGASVAALWQKRPRAGLVSAVLVGMLIVANLPAAWGADYIGENVERPGQIPGYWTDAAQHLDHESHDTRVLEIPGSDFSSYRWGNTVDPITPGLMDRPYVERELIPFGSQASADLLIAFDHRLQEGTDEPTSFAPVSRLLSAGDVLLRSDLQYERYHTPRPRTLWAAFQPTLPPGLGTPQTFGPAVPNRAPASLPLIDEIELATPPNAPWPPPVAVFPVKDAQKIIRTANPGTPVLVAGDGEGLVDAAAAGVINGTELIQYSASLRGRQPELRRALQDGAALVVTDTNRRRARRWGTIRENTGYTERAGEQPIKVDPGDARLDVFPGTGDDTRSVAEQRGVKSVMATDYGNKVSYTPEDRPANAFDGNTSTAWRVGALGDVTNQKLVIALGHNVTTDHVNLVQPITQNRDRYITGATLRFDGGSPVPVNLDPSSRTAAGQTVTFPSRTFHKVEFQIKDTNTGKRADYVGVSAVGLAELRIGGQRVDELIRMPVDLLRATGAASLNHPLTLVMTRLRANPAEPVRQDEEVALARVFDLPAARAFALSGAARITSLTDDDTIDAVLGVPDAAHGGITARSSDRLPGDVNARAAKALDGDPSTYWSPGYNEQRGQSLEYEFPQPVTFDHLDLSLVADGRHSVPTRLRIQTAGAPDRVVDVPAIRDSKTPNATVNDTVRFAPVTGKTVRIVVDDVRNVKTKDYYSRQLISMPVGIAELGIPGVTMPRPAATLPATCRTDLVTVDGKPLGVRIIGDTVTVENGGTMKLEPCDASGLSLSKGEHVVRARPGHDTGLDIDRLVLASAAGGAPSTSPLIAATGAGAGARTAAPTVRVTSSGRTSADLRVKNPGHPFWLVLGQSFNKGWKATLADGTSLGAPQLVDGMSNGWYVTPKGRGDLTIKLRWTPQGRVWIALAVSVVGVIACFAIVLLNPRRRRSRREARAARVPAGSVQPDQPVLHSPFAVNGGRPSGIVVGLTAVVVALVGTFIASPIAGVIVGIGAGVAMVRGWRLLPVAAVSALGLMTGYILLQQVRYDYPPTFDWPSHFSRVTGLAWFAVLCLAADALVEVARDRAGATAADTLPAPEPPTQEIP
jgi:arabinofuranan 3-O-arabinosyltransferase